MFNCGCIDYSSELYLSVGFAFPDYRLLSTRHPSLANDPNKLLAPGDNATPPGQLLFAQESSRTGLNRQVAKLGRADKKMDQMIVTQLMARSQGRGASDQ